MSNEIVKQDEIKAISHGPFKATSTGLVVTEENVPYELWEAYGAGVRRVAEAAQWIIGDWLNYGERKYGEMYAQAMDETDMDYGVLRNLKWVAGKLDLSRRHDKLKFGHHQEVAKLEPEEQEHWLGEAEKQGYTVRGLREAIRDERLAALNDPAQLREGKYRVIYADPPWQYGNTMPDYFTEQADHYPLMTLEEIAAMPIADMAEDDAVLFLWVTSPILEESFQVINAWGFQYKASFVWDKIAHNMGHYNSVRHEFLLICVRGSCQPDVRTLFDSVASIERGEHSAKPEYFREIIDTNYPNGNRIELFARKQTEGWETYGTEPGLS